MLFFISSQPTWHFIALSGLYPEQKKLTTRVTIQFNSCYQFQE